MAVIDKKKKKLTGILNLNGRSLSVFTLNLGETAVSRKFHVKEMKKCFWYLYLFYISS